MVLLRSTTYHLESGIVYLVNLVIQIDYPHNGNCTVPLTLRLIFFYNRC